MKELPILMTIESVRAILDGRKTQTRRVTKPQPPTDYHSPMRVSPYGWAFRKPGQGHEPHIIRFPYGQVGDRLWVRETWAAEKRLDPWKPSHLGTAATVALWYKTTDAQIDRPDQTRGKWRPSIFIPRWASRITLEITEVRVERLQEITYEDAKAEGILRFDRDNPDADGGMGYNRGYSGSPMRYESTAAFMDLWDSLNAKRGFGWESNCWVWVITFGNMGVRAK